MSTQLVARRVNRASAHAWFRAGGRVAVLDSRDGAPDRFDVTRSSVTHSRDSIGWDELLELCAGDPGPSRTVWYSVVPVPVPRTRIRIYRNTLIHPAAPNGSGIRYWSLCAGRSLRADTLEGMRELIRDALGVTR